MIHPSDDRLDIPLRRLVLAVGAVLEGIEARKQTGGAGLRPGTRRQGVVEDDRLQWAESPSARLGVEVKPATRRRPCAV